MVTAALFLFYFLYPLVILYACHRSSALKKIGAIVLAYISGLLLGNIGIFPRESLAFKEYLTEKGYLKSAEALKLFESGNITQSDLVRNQIADTSLVMTLVIPLSIPLLLFSLDIRNSLKLIKTGLLSTIVAVFSLLLAITIGFWLFGGSIPESWKVSGMLVGLYTGGTPNLAALATALDVNPNIFILTHTYDLMIGVLLLLFFITIAQKTFNKILPHFNGKDRPKKPIEVLKETEGADYFINFLNKKIGLPLLGALGLSVLIFAVGGGLSLLVPASFQMVVVILTITTLGILLSLHPKVNKIEKTFELGMYLILVFSLVVSSMADFHKIVTMEYLSLFFYVIIGVFGSMLIHVILSYIFKIDTDTTIITITALSTSHPFVPVVAGALKNKEIIVMGITIGVIGYAIGNYIGIAMAFFLKGL
jgi:uncharacterized membrane protein